MNFYEIVALRRNLIIAIRTKKNNEIKKQGRN